METINYLAYAVMELFCAVYAIGIYIKMNTNVGTQSEVKLLRHMIVAYLLFIVTDIVWALGEGRYYPFSSAANLIINGIGLFLVTCVSGYWFIFVMVKAYPHLVQKRLFIVLANIPLVFSAVFLITSYYTGWAFYIDGEGFYCRGEYYFVALFVNFLYLLTSIILALYESMHRSSLPERRSYLNLALYMIAPVLGSLMEEFVPAAPNATLSILLVIHFSFLGFQDERINNDALTGLNNRRVLETFYEKKAKSFSEQTASILMLLDIDNFKEINDTYGHVEGDNALQYMSDALKSVASDYSAFVARYGGDEFILIYTADAVTQNEIIASIHRYLRIICGERPDPVKYPMSFSAGFARCALPDDPLSSVLARADKEMYVHKKRHHASLNV